MTAQMHEPSLDSGYQIPSDVSSRSLGDLMGQVTEDLSTLVRQEVELAKAELRQEASRAGTAAGFLGGAGVAGHMVLFLFSLAVWGGLSNVMDAGWAALLVAIVWAGIAAVLYSTGKSHARRLRGMRQTKETMRRIPGAMKPTRGGIIR